MNLYRVTLKLNEKGDTKDFYVFSYTYLSAKIRVYEEWCRSKYKTGVSVESVEFLPFLF